MWANYNQTLSIRDREQRRKELYGALDILRQEGLEGYDAYRLKQRGSQSQSSLRGMNSEDINRHIDYLKKRDLQAEVFGASRKELEELESDWAAFPEQNAQRKHKQEMAKLQQAGADLLMALAGAGNSKTATPSASIPRSNSSAKRPTSSVTNLPTNPDKSRDAARSQPYYDKHGASAAVQTPAPNRTPIQKIRNLGGRSVPNAAELSGVSVESGKLFRNGTPMSGEFDYVIGMDGKFRIGKGHEFLAKASGDIDFVEAAGRIHIENGKVRLISNESGHFKPSLPTTENFPQIFDETLGVDLSGTQLKILEEVFLPGYGILDPAYIREHMRTLR